MRKLRRLPWRIPKNHHAQQPNVAVAEAPSDIGVALEIQRERDRERELHPVAFAGGRYVSVRGTEVRRKARHRVMPLPAPAI